VWEADTLVYNEHTCIIAEIIIKKWYKTLFNFFAGLWLQLNAATNCHLSSWRSHLHNRCVGTNQDASVGLSLILVQRHRKCMFWKLNNRCLRM